MSPNASQNKGAFSVETISDKETILDKEIDEFLGNGAFLGYGPDKVIIAWGRPIRTGASDSEPYFYHPDFYLEEKAPWYKFPRFGVFSRVEVGELLQKLAGHPTLDLRWESPTAEDFRDRFQFIKEKIESGQISKGVPVVFSRAQGSMTKSMRAKTFQNLLKLNEVTPYGFFSPTSGVVGASPELLLSYDSESMLLKTIALAGTRASATELENSLLLDEKERFEHDLVIKGILSKLDGLGELERGETQVWDLGTISHLRTDFTIRVRDERYSQSTESLEALIKKLHPTAALGVAPVSANWKILKACDDGVTRGGFGAPFGIMNFHGGSKFYVGIRNVQWDESGLKIGAGCGVVAQSEFDSEWNEIGLKMKYTKEILGL